MTFLLEWLFQAIGEFIIDAIYRAIGAWGCALLCFVVLTIVGLVIWAAL